MVVPLVREERWLGRLAEVQLWTPESLPSSLREGPVLIVAPHPDDETLGAGGLIAHLRSLNVEVLVAAVTDGENAYPDFDGLGPIRVKEQTDALADLGVSERHIVRLRLRDSYVSEQEEELASLLRPLVSRCGHVVAPWIGDYHPDHEACGRAVGRAIEGFHVGLTYYLFWTWHQGTEDSLSGIPLLRFPLTTHLLEAKLSALGRHRSQLYRESGGDPVLPQRLLAPAQRDFEIFVRSS